MIMIEDEMNDKELFIKLLERLSQTYPHRNLQMVGTFVYIDGIRTFNTDGFNLLYNAKRLCDELENELH